MGKLSSDSDIKRSEARQDHRNPMLCRASVSMNEEEWLRTQEFFDVLWLDAEFSGNPQASRLLRVMIRYVRHEAETGKLDMEQLKKLLHEDLVEVAVHRAMAPKKTWYPSPDLTAAVENAVLPEEIDEDLVWGRRSAAVRAKSKGGV